MNIQVKKRDGSTEPWSYDKLVTAIGKSGVPVKESEEIANRIQGWALQNAQNGVVESDQIRDKVIELMKESFQVEADSFQAYKKE